MSASAFGLPSQRVYERVSPQYKGGFGASRIEAVTADGNNVAYFSPGVFAGAPSGLAGGLNDVPSYLATRNVSGWATTAFMPPAAELPALTRRDVSPSLEQTLAFGFPASNSEGGAFEGLQGEFLIHVASAAETAKGWPQTGAPLETLNEQPVEVDYFGASDDFCHLLLGNDHSDSAPLTAAEEGTVGQLYEDVAGCKGESAELRLVGVRNGGQEPIFKSCTVDLGVENYGVERESSFNAISADGSEIFFTTCVKEGEATRYELFVRLAGERTVEVSKPLSEASGCAAAIPCPGAATRASSLFMGASEDGSRVYFTSTAALTGDTADPSENLFTATIGCPEGEADCLPENREVTSLTQVSADPNLGGKADVQGVLRVSPDGSRVYFDATGDLLEAAEQNALEAEGKPLPVVGADNLYEYDVAEPGMVQFVAELCSGHEASGPSSESKQAVFDPACPGTGSDERLWKGGESEAQTAGSDGRFLVFSSYGQLTSDDLDTARDVYRYDAASGMLERVSIGEVGTDSNGNNNRFDATLPAGHRLIGSVRNQHEMDSRAISENGSSIVFTTEEPLSNGASNGLINAYEWHEGADGGEVGLISGGSAETPVEDVVISADGSNVFFDTTQGLVRQDTDGEQDVYDARVRGGFPEPPAQLAECEAEECHGELPAPAPLLVPGSVSQEAGGNLPPPAAKPAAKAKPKKKKAKRRKSKKAHTKKGKRARRADSAPKRRPGQTRGSHR